MSRVPFFRFSGRPGQWPLLASTVVLAVLGSGTLGASSLILQKPNGQTVTYPLTPTGDVSVAPVTGNVTVRPVAAAVPAPTVNFTVSPTSLGLGGTATAAWSTTNATSCSGSGSTLPGAVASWGVSLPTSHTGLAMTLNAQGNYTFRLACTGTGGTTTVERALTVGPAIPATCTGVSPPAGMNRVLSFTNTNALRSDGNTEWPAGTEVPVTGYIPVWGPAFPHRSGTGAVPIQRGEYVAMAFNTGTATGAGTPWGGTAYGSLLWTSAQQNGGGGARVAISECPGDFTQRVPHATKCLGEGVSGSIGFIIGTTGTRCPLELNLNVGFFTSTGTSTCSNNLCHFFGQPQ